MPELLVQKRLRDGTTLEQLKDEFKLHVRRHSKYPNLVLLKYDQIESPLGDPLVQQCRGLILDENSDWLVVAYPFDKFFNYGESHAATIDWSTAEVQEKIDGSLMTLYWYNGEPHVSSSGMPDASGEVNGLGITFEELFWQAWEKKGYKLPWPNWGANCYMFELTSPYNRIVVRHQEMDLHLIGVRDLATFLEKDPLQFNSFYDVAKRFRPKSIAEVEATFGAMDPLEQEGWVVVDSDFRRIKVKHPGYVALHHALDGFGPKRMLEIIRVGESPELLTYFPEWKSIHDEILDRFNALVEHLNLHWERLKDIETQKEFALEAVKTRCSAALFARRAGKVQDFRKFLMDLNIEYLMNLLDFKNLEASRCLA